MRRFSLRALLLWPTLITFVLGIAALGFFVERSVNSDLIASVDDELIRAARAPNPPTRPNAGPAPGELSTATAPVELSIRSGEVVVLGGGNPFTETQIKELVGTAGIRTVAGDPRYRVFAQEIQANSTSITALSLASVDASMQSLRRNLILGGIVILAAQAGAIWLLSARVSRPVSKMRVLSGRIAEGDLETEISDVGGPAETHALANDLDVMVTRLRSMIEANQRAARDAEASRRDMECFLADASHELRTPLAALVGYSELYDKDMLTDKESLDRAMERIGSESERLRRLVVDMLQMSSEFGEQTIVDLGSVVASVIDDLRAVYPTTMIERSTPDRHITVLGDPNLLHQAFLNLIQNACHHSPIESPVEVDLTADTHWTTIRVIDHGPGIPDGTEEQIFLPFFRGERSRSRRTHDGAGLGLSIVKRIIDHHDGSVTVEQTPGGGATFTIRLPCAPQKLADKGVVSRFTGS